MPGWCLLQDVETVGPGQKAVDLESSPSRVVSICLGM